MFTIVIAVVAGVVTGAIVALRYIAPRTQTQVDDKARDLLERAVPFLPEELREKVAQLTK